MKKKQAALAVGFWLALSLPSLAESLPTEAGRPGASIVVRVFNYAGIPDEVVQPAQEKVERILGLAGVTVHWVDCPVAGHLDGCTTPMERNEITLRFFPRPKDKKGRFDPLSGGVAIRIGDDTGSGYITLYYNRAEEIAEQFRMKRALVLGHTIAHEIGHLLLPSGAHAGWGIMQAKLGEKEWQRAAKGSLIFTPEQAEQIKARVLRQS